MEATACLVDVTDFKSDEGVQAPWRVRFPSASAITAHRLPPEFLAANGERPLFVSSEQRIVAFVHGIDLVAKLGHDGASFDLK